MSKYITAFAITTLIFVALLNYVGVEVIRALSML